MSRSTELTTETVRVTPKLAKEWLLLNENNRAPSRTTVDLYAEDMRDGKWELTGEAIKFNGDGTLLDGQQRLMACIKAKKSFRTLVVRLVGKNTQETMDTGRRRSLGDALKMRGVTNAAFVAGMTRGLIHLKDPETLRLRTRVSHRTCLAVFDRHRDELAEVAALCNRQPRITGARPCLVGSLYFVGTYLMEDAGDEANAFLHAFRTGEGAYSGDPAIAYREAMFKLRRQGAHITYIRGMWALTMAFNLFKEGIPIEKFPWPSEPVEVIGLDVDLI